MKTTPSVKETFRLLSMQDALEPELASPALPGHGVVQEHPSRVQVALSSTPSGKKPDTFKQMATHTVLLLPDPE